MKQKKAQLQAKQYSKKNPRKSTVIEMAVKRGVREYAETFRRLAAI